MYCTDMSTSTRLSVIWLLLLAATALTWSLGEESRTGGALLAFSLLLITFFKCRAVAWDFMGLAGAGPFWRGLMMGWLLLVLALIGIAYRMGLPT